MAKKSVQFITPFLSVIAAHTETMDKPYKAGDKPKFKIRFAIDPKDIKAFQASVMKAAGNPTFSVPDPSIGISTSKKGVVTVCPTSAYKPAIFDAKNNKLEAPRIGADTIARAVVNLNVHDEGIQLQLSQVQIKKLVEYTGGAGGSSAFDEVDGYEAEGGSDFPADDAAAGTSALDI